MRTIEIVSHCHRYGRLLNYQFSSLYLYPPKRCKVILTVYHCWEDEFTKDVIRHFGLFQGGRGSRYTPAMEDRPMLVPDTRLQEFDVPETLCFWPVCVPKEKLLRRSMGRNSSASMTTADVVWFTDADYFFGEGALDALAEADLSGGKIFFPRVTYYNATHANGDQYAARIDKPQIADIDPADFVEHRPGKAIGGVQIVPGDVAREYGYCPEEKWQQPVTDGEWKDTKEDMAFRRTLDPERKRGLPLDIPNVFRIRQVNTGEVDTLTPPPSP